MVGFCHLTDSHHYHHGQKPTMVGICHGGNMPVGRFYRLSLLWLISFTLDLVPFTLYKLNQADIYKE